MKNRILKLVAATFVVCLFAFNIMSSINMDKSATKLSSLLIIAKANAEGYDECQWSYFEGGCGPFFFCCYEDNCTPECVCGEFIGGC